MVNVPAENNLTPVVGKIGWQNFQERS